MPKLWIVQKQFVLRALLIKIFSARLPINCTGHLGAKFKILLSKIKNILSHFLNKNISMTATIYYLPLLFFYILLFGLTAATWTSCPMLNMYGMADDLDEILVMSRKKSKRKKKHRYDRLDLDRHFEMCHYTNLFQSRYHMTYESFNQLVDILSIEVNEKRSRASTGGNEPITSRMIVAIGLRFMGGEKRKSLKDIFGTSTSSIDRAISIFLDSVDVSKHKDLSTDLLPSSYDDLKKVSDEWSQRSSAYGIFHGCLGAIDGWLCATEKPADISNPVDFQSGHYQRFGLNVQAMCDANLRFSYISVAATGGTNNARAF